MFTLLSYLDELIINNTTKIINPLIACINHEKIKQAYINQISSNLKYIEILSKIKILEDRLKNYRLYKIYATKFSRTNFDSFKSISIEKLMEIIVSEDYTIYISDEEMEYHLLNLLIEYPDLHENLDVRKLASN